MRKIISLLACITLFFLSCSSEEDNNSTELPLTQEGTLLKRIVSQIGSTQTISDYNYISGTHKLQNIISNNGYKAIYTYEGNLIIEIKLYYNDVIKNKENFTYDSQERMIQRKVFDYSNNKGYRAEYTYNFDGTVDVDGYNGDFNIQNNHDVNVKVFLFPNGNVQKREVYVLINGNNHVKTKLYTYDDKSEIMSSIIGFNKIKNWDTGTSGNTNNNLTIHHSTTENTSTYSDIVTYTYNSFNYPKSLSFADVTQQFYFQ